MSSLSTLYGLLGAYMARLVGMLSKQGVEYLPDRVIVVALRLEAYQLGLWEVFLQPPSGLSTYHLMKIGPAIPGMIDS